MYNLSRYLINHNVFKKHCDRNANSIAQKDFWWGGDYDTDLCTLSELRN